MRCYSLVGVVSTNRSCSRSLAFEHIPMNEHILIKNEHQKMITNEHIILRIEHERTRTLKSVHERTFLQRTLRLHLCSLHQCQNNNVEL